MLKLGVNIDHVATLRQARYRSVQYPAGNPRELSGAIPEPDPVWAAAEAELAGAHGITVHLREDRRHIQDRDVRLLRQTIRTQLNLEMADVPAIVAFAEEVRPDEVCLVPEKRQEVTTEDGLNYQNTPAILAVPHLEKLNTGHSIVSRAVFVGLRQAVREMLALLAP